MSPPVALKVLFAHQVPPSVSRSAGAELHLSGLEPAATRSGRGPRSRGVIGRLCFLLLLGAGACRTAAPDDLVAARRLVQSGRELDLAGRPEYVRHYMAGLRHADIAALERAAQLAPNLPELHFRLGLAQLQAAQFPAARRSLERAVELNPNDGSYRLPLAKTLARTGDKRRAVDEVWRAVQAGQNVMVARALMNEFADPLLEGTDKGLAALARDAPEEAVLLFEELLRAHPKAALVHALLGLSHMRLDNPSLALSALQRAVALSPEDGRLHLYLADFYRSRQRPQEALAEYEAATRCDPLLDQAHLQAAQLAFESGAFADAAPHLRALTFLAPTSRAPRIRLATVLHALGDAAGAERELRTVLAEHPDDVEATRALQALPSSRR